MKSTRSLQHVVLHGSYWFLVYAGLWVLLSNASGWGFGVICALAAAALSVWLRLPPFGLRIIFLPHFLLFFLYETLVGAWDVARRALHPNLPLSPAWVTYPLICEDPRERLLLSAMVGLMPGTLSTHFDDQYLHLHILDQSQDWRAPIAKMELHLARLLRATTS